ncbi:MAG: hypothetical protein ABI822_27180 [Bryobacteraceae bacterium]
MNLIVAIVFLASLSVSVMRAELPPGVWVRRALKDGSRVTITVESAGTSRVLTYRTERRHGTIRTLVVATALDGRDTQVSVDGKPSAQTMAFRKLDDRHTVNIVKLNGKPVSTQQFEIGADGKVIKVLTIPTDAEHQDGFTDYWDKQ